MTETYSFSNGDLAKEAMREVKMRERVYPRWVAQGRMTQAQCNERIAMMRAIMAHFMALAEKDRLL